MTRKEQILEMISEGMTTDEIAEKLFIGSETVKTYRSELLEEYQARNSAHLVRLWMEEKMPAGNPVMTTDKCNHYFVAYSSQWKICSYCGLLWSLSGHSNTV